VYQQNLSSVFSFQLQKVRDPTKHGGVPGNGGLEAGDQGTRKSAAKCTATVQLHLEKPKKRGREEWEGGGNHVLLGKGKKNKFQELLRISPGPRKDRGGEKERGGL